MDKKNEVSRIGQFSRKYYWVVDTKGDNVCYSLETFNLKPEVTKKSFYKDKKFQLIAISLPILTLSIVLYSIGLSFLLEIIMFFVLLSTPILLTHYTAKKLINIPILDAVYHYFPIKDKINGVDYKTEKLFAIPRNTKHNEFLKTLTMAEQNMLAFKMKELRETDEKRLEEWFNQVVRLRTVVPDIPIELIPLSQELVEDLIEKSELEEVKNFKNEIVNKTNESIALEEGRKVLDKLRQEQEMKDHEVLLDWIVKDKDLN